MNYLEKAPESFAKVFEKIMKYAEENETDNMIMEMDINGKTLVVDMYLKYKDKKDKTLKHNIKRKNNNNLLDLIQ